MHFALHTSIPRPVGTYDQCTDFPANGSIIHSNTLKITKSYHLNTSELIPEAVDAKWTTVICVGTAELIWATCTNARFLTCNFVQTTVVYKTKQILLASCRAAGCLVLCSRDRCLMRVMPETIQTIRVFQSPAHHARNASTVRDCRCRLRL